jgi:predicted acyl esterase
MSIPVGRKAATRGRAPAGLVRVLRALAPAPGKFPVMSGGSYVGITQFKTAETAPPRLAAIAPDEALADIYNDAYAPGGIVSLSFDWQYLAVQGGPGLVTPNTETSRCPAPWPGRASAAYRARQTDSA